MHFGEHGGYVKYEMILCGSFYATETTKNKKAGWLKVTQILRRFQILPCRPSGSALDCLRAF